MKTFLILYFANLVLDFCMQDSFIKEWKQKSNYVLFVHCAIWGIGLSLVLIPLGLFAWWKVIMLLAGHYVIDYWKCRRLYRKWPVKKLNGDEYRDEFSSMVLSDALEGEEVPLISDKTSLYIDQSLHVIQILLCLF